MSVVFNKNSKLAAYRRFLLRRGYCVLPRKGKGEVVEPKALAAILRSFESVGYELSPAVIKHLSKCPVARVTEFYNYYFDLMRDERGTYCRHPVFYPQFPNMQDVSNLEYYIRACLHYMTANARSYGFVNQDLKELEGKRHHTLRGKCDKIEGIGSQAAKKLIIDYAKRSFEGKLAINHEYIKFLKLVFHDYGDLIDIQAIPFHENIAFFVDVYGGKKNFSEKMLSFVNVPMDILRVYAVLSDDSPLLLHNVKFASLKRSHRRILLAKLNEFAEKKPNFCEDLGRNEFLWKRALEKLHPGEFSATWPVLYKAVTAFRNDDYVTYYSLLEQAKPDQDRYLDLLSRRPGEFARRLDATLRIVGYDYKKTLAAFKAVGENVSTPVLLSLWTFYQNRPSVKQRLFRYADENGYRVYQAPQGLPPMLESLRLDVLAMLESMLKEIYAKRERVEKVYLSPTLKQYAVPANARNASSANKTLTYGSRIALDPEILYLRCFTHWHNMKGAGRESRVDIDLSAQFITEDFKDRTNLAWHHLSATGKYNCFHSGDFVTAPNGASEFVDIDLEAVAPTYRYITIINSIYSGIDFASVPDCFSGVAVLSEKQYNKTREDHEKLKASTVKYKFDLTTKGCRENIAFIIDTKTRELIWVDAPFTAGFGHVAAVDPRVLFQILDALKTRMNLYDFFLLHAGHVSLVDDPKEAKLFIGEEDEANLKPYFVQDIVTDWL